MHECGRLQQAQRTSTNDTLIRKAARQRLAVTHDGEDAVIMEELRVDRGSAHVDMAVVNGVADGFEIKSDRDNLDRLERQVSFYRDVADRWFDGDSFRGPISRKPPVRYPPNSAIQQSIRSGGSLPKKPMERPGR